MLSEKIQHINAFYLQMMFVRIICYFNAVNIKEENIKRLEEELK